LWQNLLDKAGPEARAAQTGAPEVHLGQRDRRVGMQRIGAMIQDVEQHRVARACLQGGSMTDSEYVT
jgi:hypothetical protein